MASTESPASGSNFLRNLQPRHQNRYFREGGHPVLRAPALQTFWISALAVMKAKKFAFTRFKQNIIAIYLIAACADKTWARGCFGS
jgi:hypothetical protein